MFAHLIASVGEIFRHTKIFSKVISFFKDFFNLQPDNFGTFFASTIQAFATQIIHNITSNGLYGIGLLTHFFRIGNKINQSIAKRIGSTVTIAFAVEPEFVLTRVA
ncbi:hypothetical protein SDC9_176652 [bioreactor metagenome]|uniref:Uncharacterized protein n=1 Tax=bioreactor metagenome TaxID=1076179 RepID=A0A645GQM0_9ZZZZ